jgi:hypothetical protein
MTDTIAIICMVSGILLILSALIDGSKSDYVYQREDEYDDDEYEDEYYDDDEDVITEAEVVEIESNEEIQIIELIKELKSKPDKSKKDQYNIELLEVKLRQLKNKK